MIHVDFESLLVTEGNEKENKDQPFTKPFKSYIGEVAIKNFINIMLEESQYCGDVIKDHFNKELVMTKKD